MSTVFIGLKPLLFELDFDLKHLSPVFMRVLSPARAFVLAVVGKVVWCPPTAFYGYITYSRLGELLGACETISWVFQGWGGGGREQVKVELVICKETMGSSPLVSH